METEHRLTADDLFAGAGGWDVAADWLDVHARGVENMPAARATRDAAGLTTIHDDVWTFQPDGKATGLIASPPCQTFSQAGKGTGRKALDNVLALARSNDMYRLDRLRARGRELTPPKPGKEPDERTALVLTPLHLALTNPAYQWLAWEQVPTVLPVWEACAERLRAQGWSVWTGLLHSEQYGAPQTRKRAVLIASRNHAVQPPTPTHSKYHSHAPERLDPDVRKWVSMAEALGWVGVPDAPTGIRMTTMPNSARRDLGQPAPTIAFGHDAASCQWQWPDDVAERFTTPGTDAQRAWPALRPAPTMVGSFYPDIVAAPGYRTDVSRQDQPHSVRITVHEAGVLQTFPVNFPWQGAKSKQFLQAGNAIPPLMAMAALSAALGEPYLPPAPETTPEPAQTALATI